MEWFRSCALCGKALKITDPSALWKFIVFFCEDCNATKGAQDCLGLIRSLAVSALNTKQKQDFLKGLGYHIGVPSIVRGTKGLKVDRRLL